LRVFPVIACSYLLQQTFYRLLLANFKASGHPTKDEDVVDVACNPASGC